ncbi:transposase [Mesorhizobium sp. M0174]|uniref:transposase n=1 Tax=Mesorhizobium sp. M0174 TaxID=2956904 RepID=UPI00333D8E73
MRSISLGILPDGIWIEQTEGAKFWLRVMNELKNRGVADILIAVVDSLKGFPEAINAVFPQTVVQTCIVHLIRLHWSSCLGRTASLSCRRGGRDAEAALAALDTFDAGYWGQRYPAIAQSWWRRAPRAVSQRQCNFPDVLRHPIHHAGAGGSAVPLIHEAIANGDVRILTVASLTVRFMHSTCWSKDALAS